ncbi:hypothetical protein B0H14DRAFT_2673711, partial [Mycena olivaceomarginata]
SPMILLAAVIGFSSVAKLCHMLHSILPRGSSILDYSHLVYSLHLDLFPCSVSSCPRSFAYTMDLDPPLSGLGDVVDTSHGMFFRQS